MEVEALENHFQYFCKYRFSFLFTYGFQMRLKYSFFLLLGNLAENANCSFKFGSHEFSARTDPIESIVFLFCLPPFAPSEEIVTQCAFAPSPTALV